MDEIKSVIWQLPPQDIAILKTLYNPQIAKQELSNNWQRMIAILDWLSTEEQQDAVNVEAQELPQQESWDVNVEVSETNVEQTPVEWSEEMIHSDEEKVNPAWNLEDFLI